MFGGIRYILSETSIDQYKYIFDAILDPNVEGMIYMDFNHNCRGSEFERDRSYFIRNNIVIIYYDTWLHNYVKNCVKSIKEAYRGTHGHWQSFWFKTEMDLMNRCTHCPNYRGYNN